MKPIITSFIAIALGTSSISLAQTPQQLSLNKATVFVRGAELTSTAKITFAKGENEYRFTNVAGSVNTQSIVVNAGNGVVVESVTFQNNYTATDNVSPKVKEIKDSIEILTARKEPIANKELAIDEQIAILQANRKVAGEQTGLSVAELLKMLDLVGAKLESYYNLKDKTQAEQKKLDERIAGLNKQLQEEQKKGYQPGGQLLVKFFAKEATTNNINITYVVPNAGWTPTYDVWADDAKSPIKFYYKANIYQNSGVKWNNVRLTLSTGNPQEGMQAPVLSPWYLSFYVLTRKNLNRSDYYVKGADINRNQIGEDVFTTETYFNGRYQDSRNPTSMNQYVTVDNAGINTTFDIELPYTIPSDGQQHLVAVKKYDVPATYEYYAVPKADKDAFLLARITNWEDLNLLPGKTNIFYEGTYVGQGSIDTKHTKDTLSLSLGRDKKIVIKRERDKTYRSVKMIGTNVREEYAYNITVRNTRKEPVTLVLLDQMPVSNDKDIVIEDIDGGNGALDESNGMLKWGMTLNGNETKTLKFSFTLKYPKGKTLSMK